MSRLSVMRSLKRGLFPSGRLSRVHAHLVRFLSDNSDSSSDQLQSNLGKVELEKPSVQTSFRVAWPDVYSSEITDTTDDGFPPTWDFKNNELDVEQLAGLPGPNEADDPYSSFDHEQETCEEEEEHQHQQIQEVLQFGRMLALREQLNRELCPSESFSSDQLSSLASVRENVDFMMQELSQISFMLKTICPQQDDDVITYSAPNSMIEKDCVMGKSYYEPQMPSWIYAHPNLSNQDAGIKTEESMDSQVGFGSPVMISEVKEEPPAEHQDSGHVVVDALDEVITTLSDDSPKTTPAKPSESTPNPRQDPPSQETIHTYKPFRTIEVPAAEPKQSLYSQDKAEPEAVQEDTAVVERAENFPRQEGFIFSTKLSESESRFLMHMALKQALRHLESGRTNYNATLMMAEDEESHGVD